MSDQPLDPSRPQTRQPPARDDSVNRPIRKKDFVSVVVVLAVMTAGGIQVERTRIHDPWLADHEMITFFLMYLGWLLGNLIMIPVHEFAHALVGWSVGFRINSISLGCGPRLCRIPLRKMSLDIHCYPIKGVYRALPGAGVQHTWRHALMIIAGPASHLPALLAVTVLWFAAGWNQQEHFTTPSALAAGFFFCNIYLLVINLIPRNSHWNGTPLRNDGGQLLDLLTGKDASSTLMHSLNTLAALGNQGKWSEVQTASRTMLQQPSAKSPLLISSINAWLAVADVYIGGEENLNEADTLSTRCLESARNEPAILTVRACVLMAFHRNDEAESLLLKAQSGISGPYSQKAAAHLWTELHRRRNNLDQMQHWQSIAQKLDPTAAYKMFRDPTPSPAPQPI